MKIGIGLQNTIPGAPGRLLVDTARRAEEVGFSTVATLDRVAYPSYESLVALAAAAAATERIGLLTNIVLAPARNAILLAKEAASVDQISGGRLTLGLGVGARRDDFEATERDFETRGRRFDRDLELMHDAWRGEAVGGCERPPSPKPVNGDRVPILIGGDSDAAIERAVRWGEGWTAGGAPPGMVGPFAQRVREAWLASGREGAPRLVALAYYSLGEDAEAESRANLLDYYEYLGSMAEGIASSTPRTPEAIRAGLRAFDEAGFDELIFYPTVSRLDQIDRLAELVL
jgi:alkanesulfonate monooxygenase SsuD/methylene tetrahydromethanopterin reductase-like flavin-dependent oxidoreductase (luciferase family)